MRAYIINRQIDDIRGTLYRQTMFAEFEKVIHAIEEAGGALTLDIFKSEYRKLLEGYFGDAVAIDPVLELECFRIPHFYNAFYVFKYATGLSAAVALSQRVLNNEAGAVEDYLGFLRSGGSKFPLETLRNAGVDMTTAEPIQRTVAVLETRLGESEALRSRRAIFSPVCNVDTDEGAHDRARRAAIHLPQLSGSFIGCIYTPVRQALAFSIV